MIRHLNDITEIVDDLDAAAKYYTEILGLKADLSNEDDYLNVEMPGLLHFGIWARHAAAKLVFNDVTRVSDIPLGYMTAFEVDSIEGAVDVLAGHGVHFLQTAQVAWGQTTARCLSLSGSMCELSVMPWQRQITQHIQASDVTTPPPASEQMIRHVSAVAEIVDDINAGVQHYRDTLGLSVEYPVAGEEGYAIVNVPGILHFGICERASFARETFGPEAKAEDIPLGFILAFEVDDVAARAEALAKQGLKFIQPPHHTPWGQVTARYLSPSGALCELSQTPGARIMTQAFATEGDIPPPA